VRAILGVKTVWASTEARAWLKVFLYTDDTFDILGVQCWGNGGSRVWAEESSVLPCDVMRRIDEIQKGTPPPITDRAESVFASLPNGADRQYQHGESWKELAANTHQLVPRHAGPRIQTDTIRIERQPDSKLKVTWCEKASWCEGGIPLCIAGYTLLEGESLELDTTIDRMLDY